VRFATAIIRTSLVIKALLQQKPILVLSFFTILCITNYLLHEQLCKIHGQSPGQPGFDSSTDLNEAQGACLQSSWSYISSFLACDSKIA